jgi:DNA polymerase-1
MHDPKAEEWVEFCSLEKSTGTYIRRMHDGFVLPLHSRFNVLVESGRTSSSDPNLQNQPKFPGVRECFEARPGYVYISCDYDSQEMRTLAQACLVLCGQSRLAEFYQANPDFDPHVMFAADRMGISYEEGLALKKSGDKRMKDLRQKAKPANFGFPGGLGARGFVAYAKGYGVILTEQESAAIKREWLQTWPEMNTYFAVVQQMTRGEVGTVTQLYSLRKRGMVGFCNGANTFFQGLAADATKAALWEVSRRCYSVPESALYGCRVVNYIHDEIFLEAPEGYAHEAALELKQVMEQEGARFTPDIPVRASPSMMYFWSKEAVETYDQNGRLIPYDRREVAEAA